MTDAIPSGEIDGFDDETVKCAVLDTTSKKLTAIDCNDNTARSVVCQYPGLPTDGT